MAHPQFSTYLLLTDLIDEAREKNNNINTFWWEGAIIQLEKLPKYINGYNYK